jgi:hypothetical protein
MWNYYGSKSIVVDCYPPPKYGTVIEPFCGSARYALKYWDREVVLVDKYEVVIKVWRWLQSCSVQDILGLPELRKGQLISDYGLCEGATLFMGMIAGVACTSPRNKISAFASEQNGRKNKLKRIADNLPKIKHWTLIHDSYECLENREATWFIDPPYQFGGSAYVESVVDYAVLAEWSKNRGGQVIVCENTRATWMDFKPMVKMRGGNQKYTTEAIWSNEPTAFDWQQQDMFEKAQRSER